MKIQTLHTYRELASSAVEMICRGLDEDLSCQEIADRVCVSPFYFHRIFKSVCGEGPVEMAARLRMERAASQLINDETSVTEIAFQAAFESLEGFSRSFRFRFGESPSQYRKRGAVGRHALPSPNGIHWQRGDLVPHLNTIGEPPMNSTTSALRIEEIADVRVAAMRHIGPYYQIGNTFSKLKRQGAGARMFALYYDDPESTPPDKLQSDACYELADGEDPCEGAELVTISGGKYAVYRHTGHYMHLDASWGQFMQLLAQSENGSRPGPCFELYVDDCTTTPSETLRTDLYAPIQ